MSAVVAPESRIRPFGARAVLEAALLETAFLAAVATGVYLAAVAALPAYRVAAAPLWMTAAVAVPTAIVAGTARILRAPAGISYAAAGLGLGAFVTALGGTAAWSDVVHGPGLLVSETLPLGGDAPTLAPLVVVAWLAAAAATEMAVRSAAADRQPGGGLLVIAPALYVLDYAMASPAPHPDRVGAPLLVVALAVAAILRREMGASPPLPRPSSAPPGDPLPRPGEVGDTGEADTAPSPRRRAVLAGMVAAISVAATVALVGPHLPSLSRVPAQVHRRAPAALPLITDPLDAMAQLRDGEPGHSPLTVLDADLRGASTGYLALAVLDAYDGGTWSFAADFQPTGGRVPPAPASGGGVLPAPTPASPGERRSPVEQRIVLSATLPIPLLPALERPVSVSGAPVDADAPTGMLMPRPGQQVRAFSVTSAVSGATLPGIPAADGIDTASVPPADTAIPPNTSADLATTLRFLADVTHERPAPTVAFLQDARGALREAERRIDPNLATTASAPARPGTSTPAPPGSSTPAPPGSSTPAPPGSSTPAPPADAAAAGPVIGTSLSEVINAVTVNRAATPEQFATFFALVARYLGVPARVVTGFRIGPASSGQLVPAGRYRVTDRQAWAWTEISVSGLGWVVADVTPDRSTAGAVAPPESVQAPATTLAPRQANAVPRNQILGGHALAPAAHPRPSHRRAAARWAAGLYGLAGVMALGLLAGPGQAAGRRFWRRRARRQGPPAELAVGAWLELIDGLHRAGFRPVPGATSREVADEVGHHFGADLATSVAEVGAVADQALFAPGTPPDEASARAAWLGQAEVGRRVHRRLDRRHRLRSSLMVGRAPRRPD